MKSIIEGDKGFTTDYFFDYKEAKELMNSFGLTEIVFAGVENILGSKEKEISVSFYYSICTVFNGWNVISIFY